MERRIVETIEYLTQIHTAWDGTEQRMALREYPRRSVSYRYAGMTTTESSRLRALCYSSQTTQLEWPLWHAAVKLPRSLYKDQAQIKLTSLDMWNYRDCHALMLWKNDELGGDCFDLNEITADGSIYFKRQVNDDWSALGTMVVPIFWGVLKQEDNYGNITSNIADLNINVDVMPAITAANLPAAVNEYNYPRLVFPFTQNAESTYMDTELFLMPPAWVDDEDIGYMRNANRLDNNTGVFRYDLKSSAITTNKSLEYLPISMEEIQFMQRFFYRCKGQFKSFYAPTWTSDIELSADAEIGSTYLLTKFAMYYKYYGLNARRKLLLVFYVDGTIEILNIAGFSITDDGYGKVFLKIPLRRDLIRNQIAMISFLCKWRLASDKLIIDYETTDIANVTLEMKEVDD